MAIITLLETEFPQENCWVCVPAYEKPLVLQYAMQLASVYEAEVVKLPSQ